MFPPPLPGEAMFLDSGRVPSLIQSWPMPIEEPFTCGRDRHLVQGNPGMAYTLHACWYESPCTEWRFDTQQYMELMERKVARIAAENRVRVRTHQRGRGGIVCTFYDFRPPQIPEPPTRKVVIYLMAAVLLFILLNSL